MPEIVPHEKSMAIRATAQKTLLKYRRCVLMAVVIGKSLFSPRTVIIVIIIYIFTIQRTTILYLECAKIITH